MSTSSFSDPQGPALRHTAVGRLVRDALIHLNDLPYLQTHPLADAFVPQPNTHPAARGKLVQQRLVSAIDELRPAVHGPASDRVWRRYQVLLLRYVEGLEIPAICQQLGMSESAYFRELRQGLEAITFVLRTSVGAGQGAVKALPHRISPLDSAAGLSDVASQPVAGAGPAMAALPTRTPLIGRIHELDFLTAQYEAVAAGAGGRLILVSGEAGVGKTRLAEELGQYAERHGGVFAASRYVRAGVPPYRVWVEALRPLLRDLAQDELALAAGTYGLELTQIFPELAARVGPFPAAAGLDPEEQRLRLYDGIVEVVNYLSSHQPLVLLLDDLQWAPALTLLDHVVRHIGTCRVLLVGTYREQEFNERISLLRDRDDLYRARLSTHLALNPLDAEQTDQMVVQYLGSTAPYLRDQIYRTTRGNPYFVEEVLRSLVESGAVRPTETGWELRDPSLVQLPDSVKRLVEDRVARLGEVAHNVLVQAAVLGPEFSFAVLVATTGHAEDLLADSMDRAVGARLLADRSSPGKERYAFVDDQVQEVLYESIPQSLLRRFHRRAGLAIEELYQDRLYEYARELAWHFGHGTERDALEKALRYGEEAARQASAVYSYREAVAQLERALALHKVLHPDDLAKRCDLVLALGEALMPAGEPLRAAEQVAPEALQLAEAAGDADRAAAACQIALRAFYRYGGLTTVGTDSYRQWAERADRYTKPETPARVWADGALADAALMAGRYAEASTRVSRALALARRLGEPEEQFIAAFKALNLLVAPWEQEERRQLAHEVTHWPRQGVAASTLHLALSECAGALLDCGEREQAEALWGEIAELGQRTLEPLARLRPFMSEMTLCLLNGELEAAVETGVRLVALGDELGSPVAARQVAAFSSLRPLLYLGQQLQALALLEQWSRIAGAQQLRMGAARRGLVLAMLGRRDEASAILHRMVSKGSGGMVSPAEMTWPLAGALLEIAIVLKDHDCAASLAQYLSDLGDWYNARLDVCLGRLLGDAAMLHGDWYVAKERYQSALDLAIRLQHRPETALIRLSIAEVEAASGRNQAACENIAFCIPELEQMNMLPARNHAQSLQETLPLN